MHRIFGIDKWRRWLIQVTKIYQNNCYDSKGLLDTYVLLQTDEMISGCRYFKPFKSLYNRQDSNSMVAVFEWVVFNNQGIKLLGCENMCSI